MRHVRSCYCSHFLASFYGPKNAYFELVAIGLFGVSIGYVPIDKVTYCPASLRAGRAYAGFLCNNAVGRVVRHSECWVCLSLAMIYVFGARNRGVEFVWGQLFCWGSTHCSVT